jgi:hypothetical protein
LKLGKFVTLEGAETIDPRSNPFYSHTYIFNFGIPFTHLGALADWHATSHLDWYAGLTRGVNTSIYDNNESVAFHGGIGLNLCNGNLTALATTHIGPETANNNHDYRYLNDMTITVKPAKKVTLVTDLNYIYDAAADATGFGGRPVFHLHDQRSPFDWSEWRSLARRRRILRIITLVIPGALRH